MCPEAKWTNLTSKWKPHILGQGQSITKWSIYNNKKVNIYSTLRMCQVLF
jgi:hypothetical protein